MSKKLKVGVLFGGKSAEHEVSLQSAKNVIQALDKEKYDVVEIKIEKDGTWDMNILKSIDVAFPIIHGTMGEDGSLQGLFEILDIPYVGANVLGSSVAMDKDTSKRLFLEAGLPVAKCLVIHQGESTLHKFGWPVFVKPANLGSSVGISKANNQEEYDTAVALAFSYDTKILVEEFIEGRELDVAVLGNEKLEATIPAEIITKREFYDYQAKYVDDDTKIVVPADIPDRLMDEAKRLSIAACKVLNVQGMARVELFLKRDESLVVSEVNTIPGFTSHSIYPRLWEASGLSSSKLIATLIELALARHQRNKALKTTHEV